MSTFIVWKQWHFYAGTLRAPFDDFVRTRGWDLACFDSEEEAKEYIDEKNRGVYYLAHSEYAPPEFTVMRLLDEEQDWDNDRTMYRLERDGQEVLAIQDSSVTSWEVAA